MQDNRDHGLYDALSRKSGLLFVPADANLDNMMNPMIVAAWENSTKSGSGTIDWHTVFGVPFGARAIWAQILGAVGASPGYAAASNSDLSLTGSYQDVPGATLTLAEVGTYLIIGTFEFELGNQQDLAEGQLLVDGSAQAGVAHAMGHYATASANATGTGALGGTIPPGLTHSDSIDLTFAFTHYGQKLTVTQTWVVTTVGANKVAKLQAKGATGENCLQVNTTIRAICMAPTSQTVIFAANSGYTTPPVYVTGNGNLQNISEHVIIPVDRDGLSYYSFTSAWYSFWLRVLGWFV